MHLPRRSWILINRLCAGVKRFRYSPNSCGIATVVGWECSAENQKTVHIKTDWLFYSPHHNTDRLIPLDEDTTIWIQKACLGI